MHKLENGNCQVNTLRNEFNDRVNKKIILGNSKRITWNNVRRFRTI